MISTTVALIVASGLTLVDLGCDSSFGDFEGDLIVVESLLCVVGIKGTCGALSQWSWLPRMSVIG